MPSYGINYKKISLFFFYILFAISNFNALIQIFVPRIAYTVFYSIILFIAICAYIIHENYRLSRNDLKRDRLVFVFIFICICRFVVQFVMGDYTELSLNRFLQTIVPILVYFPATILGAEDKRQLETFYIKCAVVSVFCGLLNQLIGIIPSQYFANEMVNVGGHIMSRSYSMAGFSIGTGVICGIGIALLLKNRNEFTITFRIFITIVFLYGLLATFSRGGVFFTGIILVIYVILNLIYSGNKIDKRVLVTFLAAVLIFFGIFVAYEDKIVQSSFWGRYVLNAFDSSTSLRRNFQIKAVELIKVYPFWGRGFGFVGSNAYSQSIGEGFPPENNYYLMAIDCGLVATGAYMLFVLKGIWNEWKNRVKNQNAYIGIIVGFMMWSLMSTPFEGDLNAAFFWYCIGSVMCYKQA